MNIDLRNWPTACQSAGKPSRASVDHALYETKSGPSRSFLANDRKGSNRYTRAGAHRTTTLQDAQRCAGRAIQAVSGAVRTNSRSSEILRRSFEHHSNAGRFTIGIHFGIYVGEILSVLSQCRGNIERSEAAARQSETESSSMGRARPSPRRKRLAVVMRR